MNKTNPNPHARFHVLINQMQGADKEELVWTYSHKLTTSLAEFLEKRPADYQRMIQDMQRIVNSQTKQQDDTQNLKKELEQFKK
ncbi:hypothetical protein D0T84_22460, partial [Dysgonomonas sp. 521]|uniref:hypothetical protein n=1 Tax=Dysgonomonas sp. 521 TaxID=2302932 RepID=UPI0013D313AF